MRFYEHARSSGFHKKRASFRSPHHEDILEEYGYRGGPGSDWLRAGRSGDRIVVWVG